MTKWILLSLLFLGTTAAGFSQTQKPIVYVKHVELPSRYPVLARQAQLQGIVTVNLAIGADGTVLSANASSNDPLLEKVPLLQTFSSELVKKWTFGCFGCVLGDSFEHVMRFVYKLEGEPKSYDETRLVLDFPNEVTVIDSPPQCDHCPSAPKEKTSTRSKR